MKKYRIEEVKCGIAGGPFSEYVVATLKFNDGKKSQWLTNVEYDGFPAFYLSDDDLFEKIMLTNENEKELEDEEELEDALQAELDDHYLDTFDDIELGEYETIFDSIAENQNSSAIPLIRYLIAVTRCEPEDTNRLMAEATGMFIDEFDIPVSDVEEDWLSNNDD